MEINEVFSAKPESIWQFLCTNGQGLYIPSYQRQFAWSEENVSQFFEDVCHGFASLIEQDDSITFIGTIITVHDTKFKTVLPIVRQHLPSKVMTIIDGQQRLTTILIAATILHDHLRKSRNFLSNNNDNDAINWLSEECLKAINRLEKTFQEDMSYGDPGYQYYPRMIRAYEDSWSISKSSALYRSPIAIYLHEYTKFFRSGKTDFVFDQTEKDNKHAIFGKIRNFILGIIEGIKDNLKMDFQSPSLDNILDNENFQQALFNNTIGDHKEFFKRQEDGYCEILRLVLFCNYFLNRVAITIVTARDEDYAFDLFQSLNTTGEPLTAFETFRPSVIAAVSLPVYESSNSRLHLKDVEDYLDGFDQKHRQDSTSNLIIHFSLADFGEKRSKKLREQRAFFKKHYDSLPSLALKERFTQNLSRSAKFLSSFWDYEKNVLPDFGINLGIDYNDVALCIDFLKSLKHNIVFPLLCCFYYQILEQKNEESKKEFAMAVKAVTAFSFLWRSSRTGTQGIDSVYRILMQKGWERTGLEAIANLKNTNGYSKNTSLKAQNLIDALRDILESEAEIESREKWVMETSKQGIYLNNQTITKFAILAAANNSIIDPEEPGLIKKGRKGVLEIFTLDHWRNEDMLTIEHVAPQKKSDNWGDEIYQESKNIHRLGNLTLLPKWANSLINNKSWDKKKVIYRLLSAQSAEEYNSILASAKNAGLEINKNSNEVIFGAKYLPMVHSIANCNEKWSLELIEKRSKRLANLAFDEISAWLGY